MTAILALGCAPSLREWTGQPVYPPKLWITMWIESGNSLPLQTRRGPYRSVRLLIRSETAHLALRLRCEHFRWRGRIAALIVLGLDLGDIAQTLHHPRIDAAFGKLTVLVCRANRLAHQQR